MTQIAQCIENEYYCLLICDAKHIGRQAAALDSIAPYF